MREWVVVVVGVAIAAVGSRQVGGGSSSAALPPCLRATAQVEEYNTLCELAFQCRRQFCGISLLLKCRCFTCHRRAR